MRATQELLSKLESIEELNHLHVLELRISILEYMNHLLQAYPLHEGENKEVNDCIAKLQDNYSVLQQLSNNRHTDLSDPLFVNMLIRQTKESVECIQEILMKEKIAG